MKKIVHAMKNAARAGFAAVLVTVIDSSGSVPRGAGASMLVLPDGSAVGTVGGGSVELAAAEKALSCLEEKHGCIMEQALSGSGMVCGGSVRLHFRYLPPGDGSAAEALGQTGLLTLELLPDGSGELSVLPFESGQPRPPCVCSRDGREFFVQPLNCYERVFVFGGGHVSRALDPVLASVGFRCTVADDRKGILTQDAFPTAERLVQRPFDGLISTLDITGADYIIIMTYGHSSDYILTKQALETPARYIGVLGSRTKAENAVLRLRAEGAAEEQIARIHCPIGLPIGGNTPEEIAVSIAAQLIAERNGKL